MLYHLGYALLIVVGTAFVTLALAARVLEPPGPSPEHEAYLRGWDSCSRIRDREEVQARKERLLRGGGS